MVGEAEGTVLGALGKGTVGAPGNGGNFAGGTSDMAGMADGCSCDTGSGPRTRTGGSWNMGEIGPSEGGIAISGSSPAWIVGATGSLGASLSAGMNMGFCAAGNCALPVGVVAAICCSFARVVVVNADACSFTDILGEIVRATSSASGFWSAVG
jgi:hypothetical protein